MSDDQDGCEWVNVSSGTGLPGSPGQKAVKRLCVCVEFQTKLISLLGYNSLYWGIVFSRHGVEMVLVK